MIALFQITSAILLIFPLHFQINFRKNFCLYLLPKILLGSSTREIKSIWGELSSLQRWVFQSRNTVPLRSLISFISTLYFSAYRTWTCLVGRRQWHPTPVPLPGKSHRWRSLVGCNPWGRQESDTTEQLHFHFSLSCIAEGNGNRLQCSCLENPRDGGAWWAAVYGVAQSWTRLKWLSSSS